MGTYYTMIELLNMEYNGRIYTVPGCTAYLRERHGMVFAHTYLHSDIAVQDITTFSHYRLFKQDFLIPDVAEFLKRTTNYLIVGYRTELGKYIWPLARVPQLRSRSNPQISREYWGQYREEELSAITSLV